MRAPLRRLVALLAVALVAAGCGQEPSKPKRAEGLPKLPWVRGGGEQAAHADAMPTSTPRELRLELGTVHPFEQVPAYRLAASSRQGDVERIAKALGLDAKVERAGKGWVVRGAALELRVDPIPGAPWYLGPPHERCDPPASSDPDAPVSSSGCPPDAPHAGSGGGSSVSGSSSGGSASSGAAPTSTSTTSISCDMPPCPEGHACAQVCPERRQLDPDEAPHDQPQRPAGLPTREEAERRGREILLAAGAMADGSGDVIVVDGFDAWEVRVKSEAGGLEVIGLDASVAIGPGGTIVRASGWLAPGERLGEYPLLTPERAFDRLREQYAGGIAAAEMDTPCADPADAPVTDCTSVPAEPQLPIVLTTVRPVLIFSPMAHSAYLIPGLAFRADGGEDGAIELSVVAVQDRFLDKAAPGGGEPPRR